MNRVYHGGYCCGMTHIYGFPVSPNGQESAVKRLTQQQVLERNVANPLASRHHNCEYPWQTAAERLTQMIREIEQGVPQDPTGSDPHMYQQARARGIIEVVLVDNQLVYWGGVLKDLDFVEVNANMNSNSQRMIRVFHRNSGAEGVRPIPPAEVRAETKAEPKPVPVSVTAPSASAPLFSSI